MECLVKKHIKEEELLDVPDFIIEMRKKAKKMGLTHDRMIEDLREIRRELYKEQYGDD